MSREHLVFVSHAYTDRWIARKMCDILEQSSARIRTFLDERVIQPGDSIPEHVRDNLLACQEFVVLLTPESITRDWVKIEIAGAWIQRKRITAVCYRVEHRDVPFLLSDLRYVELADFDAEVVPAIVRRAEEVVDDA